MRIANLSGRLVLVTPDGSGAVDVERASRGRFGPDVQAVYEQWAEFTAWAADADMTAADPFVVDDLEAPAPAPPQVLAKGQNNNAHPPAYGITLPPSPRWGGCSPRGGPPPIFGGGPTLGGPPPPGRGPPPPGRCWPSA